MKTFLWTSLFWILMIVAWFLCLGFFDIMNPVYYPASIFIAKYTSSDIKGIIIDDFMNSDNFKKSSQFQEILDNNCVVPACDCPVEIHEAVCPTLECPKDEEKVCPVCEQSVPQVQNYGEDFGILKEGVASMLSNQALILNSVQGISQQISSLKVACESPEVAQKKTEIQSKIEALQAEMANLQNEYNTL